MNAHYPSRGRVKAFATTEGTSSGGINLVQVPIEMILTCPSCCGRHIDEGEFATKHHHTHACQHCGFVWRPAVVPTVGVQFLTGFKNGKSA